jgi:hypothetical protein
MFRKILVLMLLGTLVAGVGAAAFAGRTPGGFDWGNAFAKSERGDHEDGHDDD